MSGNEIQMFDPEVLKQKLADMTKNAFFGSIPDSVFEQMVEKEVQAYFTNEQWVKVEIVKDKFKNPRHNPNASSSNWENQKFIEQEVIAMSRKMTPFRQSVWQVLNELFKDRLDQLIAEQKDDLTTELGALISRSYDTLIKGTASAKMGALMELYATQQIDSVIRGTMSGVQSEMKNLLMRNGIHPNPV